MLQISQIEKPTCSATMDQMRLRRATNLPPDSQNFSSSGFQSVIQVVFRLVTGISSRGQAPLHRNQSAHGPRKARANVMSLGDRRFYRPRVETCVVCARGGVNFVQSLRQRNKGSKVS